MNARSFLYTVLLLFVGISAWAQVGVITYHNDNNRSGQISSETILTPANVNVGSFGKIFSYSVDGFVAAQPLYLPNVPIGGQKHNVVFIATQHDSVFAFDADNLGTGTPLWTASFINPANGVTTVPIAEQGCGSATSYTEIGITGTPVIDRVKGILYVVAKTKENGSYVFRLHALDVRSGAEKPGSPAVISATFQGRNGTVTFNTLPQLQRPALLLMNSTIYVAFGSNGCDSNAHGWLMAYSYDGTTLQQAGVFNDSPNVSAGGSFWQSGVGVAGDIAGNVYLATANGKFDQDTGGGDYGDSILKLTLGGGSLSVSDYFTPFDQANLSAKDIDLGSGGVLLLPDQPGPNPHLLLQAGKEGTIYLVNRDAMGGYNSVDNSQIVQSLTKAVGPMFSAPIFWNNIVYFSGKSDGLKAFSLTNGLLSSSPIKQTVSLSVAGIPSISANGSTNGIVWHILSTPQKNGALVAFDAITLHELYDTQMLGSRDAVGPIPHFITPTIANGKVYVGTQSQVQVYGLLPALNATSGNNQSGVVGTTLAAPLTVTASNPYTGQPISGVTVTFGDNNKGGVFGSQQVVTGSDGTASTTYTLPTTSGTIPITATSPNFATAKFTETATASGPVNMVIVSGQNQTGPVATALTNPFVVKVKDANNNGVPGISVSFDDSNSGGSYSANPAITDANGRASTTYTTGTTAKIVSVKATSSGLNNLTFKVTVTAGAPASATAVSGNNQTGPSNTALPLPLVVGVQDQYGNAVPNIAVTFDDSGAGGLFSSNPVSTGTDGQASVVYTTPANTGIVTINGSVASIPPAVFTETVQ